MASAQLRQRTLGMTGDNSVANQDVDFDPEPGAEVGAIKSPKRAYSKLGIDLTEEDLKSPGVQKMLLSEIGRLEHDASKYDRSRDELAASREQCAVLREKLKAGTALEVLYSAGLGLGGALVGLTPSLKESAWAPSTVLGVGALLIVTAIVAKVKQK